MDSRASDQSARQAAYADADALLEAAFRRGGPRAGLAAAASLIEAVVVCWGGGGPFDAGALEGQLGQGRIGRDRRRALNDGVDRLRLSAGTFRLLANVLAQVPSETEVPGEPAAPPPPAT